MLNSASDESDLIARMLSVFRNGFVQLSIELQNIANSKTCRKIFGIQLEHVAECRDCFGELSLRLQSCAESKVEVDIAAIDGNRTADHLLGNLGVARLLRDRTEAKQTGRVPHVDREDLQIEVLRLVQPACLMLGHSVGQQRCQPLALCFLRSPTPFHRIDSIIPARRKPREVGTGLRTDVLERTTTPAALLCERPRTES